LIAWYRGALKSFHTIFHPMVAMRILCEAAATVAFLTALSHMPLANVTAVMQALPLAVTVGAALFLQEPVGWRRWSAIAVGFAGMLIIVRPGGEGFNTYSLYALASVLFSGARDLVTKKVPPEISSLMMTTGTAIIVALLGGAIGLLENDWRPMDAGTTLVLLGAAMLLIVGQQCIILSVRGSDISLVAPFRYTSLVWAITLGYLIFSDIPRWSTIVGALIVVGSGIYALYREKVVDATKPVATSSLDAGTPDGL
jgi:drug/metabolite transporter (DMT)-like permease